jgi:hypothetical protein
MQCTLQDSQGPHCAFGMISGDMWLLLLWRRFVRCCCTLLLLPAARLLGVLENGQEYTNLVERPGR